MGFGTENDPPARFRPIVQATRALLTALGVSPRAAGDEAVSFDPSRMHLVANGPNVGALFPLPGSPFINQTFQSAVPPAGRAGVITVTAGDQEVLIRSLRVFGAAAVMLYVYLQRASLTDPVEANPATTALDTNLLVYGSTVPTFTVKSGDKSTATFPNNGAGLVLPAPRFATVTWNSAAEPPGTSDLAFRFPRIPRGHRLCVVSINVVQAVTIDLCAGDIAPGVAQT